MHAAVVTKFDAPPSYQEFPTPTPNDSDEVLVDVVASGLHRRVRSQADGSHYTSTGDLPLVPGVDGVGRMPDGTLRYFALGDTTSGAPGRRNRQRRLTYRRPRCSASRCRVGLAGHRQRRADCADSLDRTGRQWPKPLPPSPVQILFGCLLASLGCLLGGA
jgi:hypothetical protein